MHARKETSDEHGNLLALAVKLPARKKLAMKGAAMKDPHTVLGHTHNIILFMSLPLWEMATAPQQRVKGLCLLRGK
jgi:hypothetical protein